MIYTVLVMFLSILSARRAGSFETYGVFGVSALTSVAQCVP